MKKSRLFILIGIVALAGLVMAQVPGKHFSFTPDRFWSNAGVIATDSRVESRGTTNGFRAQYSEAVYTTLAESSTGDLTASVTGLNTATRRSLLGAMIVPVAFSSGNLVGVRGSATLTVLTAFSGGYLYGVQGKFVGSTGTFTSDAKATGALGQADLTGTTITAGQASGVWGDLQGNPTIAASGQVYPLRGTNSMSVACSALLYLYGESAYLFETGLAEGTYCLTAGTNSASAGAATGVAAKVLRVNISGTTYYIPLFAGNT